LASPARRRCCRTGYTEDGFEIYLGVDSAETVEPLLEANRMASAGSAREYGCVSKGPHASR
jgi:hypothetical protein